MFIVLEKNTYSGDGCRNTGDYSVSRVIGFFASMEEAEAWCEGKDNYSTEYEAFEVEKAD